MIDTEQSTTGNSNLVRIVSNSSKYSLSKTEVTLKGQFILQNGELKWTTLRRLRGKNSWILASIPWILSSTSLYTPHEVTSGC